jgi:hypothetical protein
MRWGIEERGGAGGCEPLETSAGWNAIGPLGRQRLGTPRSRWVSAALGGKVGGELSNSSRKIASTPSGTTVCGRRSRPIRQNIIGRSTPVLRQRVAAGVSRLMGLRRPLALLDQPAGEHGGAVFFHPLIEKRANLLAKIGGMTKPREFVALQRIARSREQKRPRWLGSGTDRVGLLRNNNICTVTEQ